MNENNANFTPAAPNFKTLVRMSFQGLTNFPYIEEDFDALTNYGLLSKVVEYLNTVISNNNEQNTLMTNLYNAYVSLQNYVNNYFDNLDVQDEINNKLDKMAQDGTLTQLIKGYVDPYIEAQNAEITDFKNNINEQVNQLSSQVSSLASGSPKGVYATTAALISANPETGVYIITADGHIYSWTKDATNAIDLGVYQATGIDENSVEIKNLSSSAKLMNNARIPSFTENEGYRNGSSILNQYGFNYTSAISLSKGECITFKSRGYSNVVNILSLVNSENTYIQTLIKSNDANDHYFSYIATNDCYVSLSYQTNTLLDLGIFKDYQSSINDLKNIQLGEITNNYYINNNGNAVSHNYGAYSITDYIKILPNTKFDLVGINWTFSDNNVGYAFYDKNKNFISFVENTINVNYQYTSPTNAYYVRHTLATSNIQKTQLFINKLIDGEYALYDKILNINSNSTFSSFIKLGVIGDSLASGESVAVSDGHAQYIDNYDYSWGQFIARKYGMNCINFSAGGLTTRSWLSSPSGLSKLQNNDNKCNVYIIGLGVNDANHLGTDYIGSIDDIDVNDYTNNKDTFYGNYGKIISHIKLVQPKAKIFMLTIPNQLSNETQYDDFNTAIRNIATLFTNVYIIDLAENYQDYFTTGFIYNNLRGGHYNAIAYNYIGDLLYKWISDYMLSNYTDFRQIEFIGTDYNYYN